MKHSILLLSFFVHLSLTAAVGDTTLILSHQNTNLNSPPSNDDFWVTLPNNKNWSKIIMKFTLGCGTPNCSGWDYTVTTSLGKKTGLIDSSIVSIDTLTNDTAWTYSPNQQFWQVGKLITPYGTYMANQTNGYNRQWTHPYYYDLTDYSAILKDSVNVRVHYDGWTDAFSAKIEFLLIEGLPNKTLLQTDQIYNVYASYPNSAGFESTMTPKTVFVPNNATSTKMNVIVTGHGSQGEFDPRMMQVNVNGATIYDRLLWKGDCGMVAIAPQGGTWVFNRANWCPGEKVDVFEIDLSQFVVKGQNNTIDIDMEDYTVASGQTAGYGFAAHIISFGSQPNNDVALEQIVSPNLDANYGRFNPICGQPEVIIKNEGKLQLTQCDIAYWVEGGNKCYHVWRGNLNTYETTKVKLPSFDWSGMDTSIKRFYAEVSWPNNKPDEYSTNNIGYSNFRLVPRVDSIFIINLRTNNRPEENSYLVRNENGDTIYFKKTFAASTTYNDTVVLSDGCYSFDLYDYDNQWEGGDGLSWWLNTQQGLETSGSISLKRLGGSTFKTFNPDFGSNLHYEFTVGFQQGFNTPKAICTEPIHNLGLEELKGDILISLFPNPTNENINIVSNISLSNCTIAIIDLKGQITFESIININEHTTNTLKLKNKLAKGVYILSLKHTNTSQNFKLIVN